jgi:hypothetical protein
MRSIGVGLFVAAAFVLVVTVGGYIQARTGRAVTEPVAWLNLSAEERDRKRAVRDSRLASWRPKLGWTLVLATAIAALGLVLVAVG